MNYNEAEIAIKNLGAKITTTNRQRNNNSIQFTFSDDYRYVLRENCLRGYMIDENMTWPRESYHKKCDGYGDGINKLIAHKNRVIRKKPYIATLVYNAVWDLMSSLGWNYSLTDKFYAIRDKAVKIAKKLNTRDEKVIENIVFEVYRTM